LYRVGIFKESKGARNCGGRGLSYQPARLHRLAESIPWNRFLGSIKVFKISPLFVLLRQFVFFASISPISGISRVRSASIFRICGINRIRFDLYKLWNKQVRFSSISKTKPVGIEPRPQKKISKLKVDAIDTKLNDHSRKCLKT
jgi:hypothetical protein